MTFNTLVERVREDFAEMPGLEVTMAQGVRLWNIGADDCRFVIDALVDVGFLKWTTKRTVIRTGRSLDAGKGRSPAELQIGEIGLLPSNRIVRIGLEQPTSSVRHLLAPPELLDLLHGARHLVVEEDSAHFGRRRRRVGQHHRRPARGRRRWRRSGRGGCGALSRSSATTWAVSRDAGVPARRDLALGLR